MAAPAPTAANNNNPAPRWPRAGDTPNSPFRSSRGASTSSSGPAGRGRGAPGSRGARGPGRAANADDPPKPSTTVPASSVASKPRPTPSRRSSRAAPPPVQTHLPTADVPPAPHSARPSSTRRRRSTQAPKTPAHVPPSIHAPAPSDALLRPGRPRLPAVPHTAPIKDTPPHLRPAASSVANPAPRTDIRNDIDALVERVRASAMDHHRPSTPGSHIDWAGDDDDSLPDLDDWGVSPAVFAAAKSDTISPIIVDGLRPLPDLAPQSYHASPLQREVSPPPMVESHVGPSPEETTPESQPSEKEPTPEPSPVGTKPAPSPSPVVSNNNGNGRRPLHPSLPAKPSTVLAVAPPKPVAAATPMRIASHPKSATHDTFAGKALPKSAVQDTPVQADTTPRATEVREEPAGKEKSEEAVTAVEAVVTATTTVAVSEKASSKEDLVPTTTTPPVVRPSSRDPIDDFAVADGLGASIHAPRPGTHTAVDVDAVRSAPAAVASFPDVRSLHSAPPVPSHSHAQTHTRAHTVGRGPLPNGGGVRSPGMRSSRGGGRGGGGEGGGGAHLRNHSSPAAGGPYRSAHTHARPVLTGAALSLLTKTIGSAGGSPNKSQTVTTLGD